MNEQNKFKPLWMIHNTTYRNLVRGMARKRWKRYLNKILKMLKLKK